MASEPPPPRDPYEIASFARSSRSGTPLRLTVSARTEGNASTASLAFDSLQGKQLRLQVRLDPGEGEARMQIDSDDIDYYWWLGGDDVPMVEGHAQGRSFGGPISRGIQGFNPLDTYIPDPLRGLLEVFRPDVEAAFESVTPSELDDPELEGPGAWRLKPEWWHRWKEVKHQCAGLANAATWICCAVGGAATLVTANPVVIGAGTAVGCIFGAYVTGVAGSMCQENVLKGKPSSKE